MTIRKALSALGAALLMTTIGTTASAFDCAGNGNANDAPTIAANLIDLAAKLRCDSADTTDDDYIAWPSDNPLWERRRVPSCDVHTRLARQLYEERDFSDPDEKPRKNKHATNVAKGSAQEVKNGKYVDALGHLDALLADIARAKLNREFKPGGAEGAKLLVMSLVGEIDEAYACINALITP